MQLQSELDSITSSATAIASAVLGRATAQNYRTIFQHDGRTLTAVLIGSRYRAKAATEAAMTATLTRSIGSPITPVTVPYDAVKFTPAGVDTGAVLARVPGLIEAKIAAGAAPEIAVSQGVNLANSLVVSEAFRANRATVEEATATDPRFSGWVRVAEAGACDFCEMLASRGAVYKSEDTASGSLDYHNNCRCYAEEVVDREVARVIARNGQAAWEAQVAAGRAPSISRGGVVGSTPDQAANIAGLSRERALDVLSKRLAFYEDMAAEQSSIPGRGNYARSNAEKVRRQRERLLRT